MAKLDLTGAAHDKRLKSVTGVGLSDDQKDAFDGLAVLDAVALAILGELVALNDKLANIHADDSGSIRRNLDTIAKAAETVGAAAEKFASTISVNKRTGIGRVGISAGRPDIAPGGAGT